MINAKKSVHRIVDLLLIDDVSISQAELNKLNEFSIIDVFQPQSYLVRRKERSRKKSTSQLALAIKEHLLIDGHHSFGSLQ